MEEISVLIARAQGGEKDAREVLIEENLGLVRHVAKRFWGRGAEMEDLFQIGTIGLMKAIDKFDLSLGVQFSTYAVPLIMGEIRRFLRDDGPVKISRTVRENSMKLAGIRERLQESLGRDPRLEELMEAAGLSREDTILAMEADVTVSSLEEQMSYGEEKGSLLLDRLTHNPRGGGSLCSDYGDPEKEKLLDHMLLKQLLESLPKEDQKLIYLRFFKELTQTQVAKEFGVSQVQVSRREKSILEKLRQRAIS